MSQYFFATGSLYGRQTGVSNPTPIKFGALQEASVDWSFETKELFGQYQFPVATARGTGKITGKAKFAQLNGATLNNMFFGTAVVGTTPVFTSIDELGTVANNNTVIVTNGANFIQDLGVINTNLGILMNRVAASPAGNGNYAVNETNGNYTFNNSMVGVIVAISYDYTGAAGSGTLITGANQLQGAAPQFLVVLSGSFQSKAMRLRLNACIAGKLTMATKMADYMLPEFDFSAFVDVGGNWGQFSFAE